VDLIAKVWADQRQVAGQFIAGQERMQRDAKAGDLRAEVAARRNVE
jgi:hypothetical protein